MTRFFAGCMVAVTGLSVLAAAPETTKQQASYAIGVSIANDMINNAEDIDGKMVLAGMQDKMGGADLQLTDEQMQEAMQAFQQEMMMKRMAKMQEEAEANLATGSKFLAENAKAEGVSSTVSGLQYAVVKAGEGPKPGPDSKVTVHYTGRLLDGTVFDSSVQRGEPVTFGLTGVIPGWTEGLQLMPVGSKYRFWIPASLAYGPQGRPGIPPNSVLDFDVELISIEE